MRRISAMSRLPIQESLPGLARLRAGNGKFCAFLLYERRYLIRVAIQSTRTSPNQLQRCCATPCSIRVPLSANMIARMSITELTMAVLPWLVTMVIFLVIVTHWPELTLFLPRVLGML
jgi:hypothetical protein